jgi:hypothetical protein
VLPRPGCNGYTHSDEAKLSGGCLPNAIKITIGHIRSGAGNWFAELTHLIGHLFLVEKSLTDRKPTFAHSPPLETGVARDSHWRSSRPYCGADPWEPRDMKNVSAIRNHAGSVLCPLAIIDQRDFPVGSTKRGRRCEEGGREGVSLGARATLWRLLHCVIMSTIGAKPGVSFLRLCDDQFPFPPPSDISPK